MTSQGARCGPPPHPGAPSLLLSGSTDVEEDQDHLDQGGSAPAAADPAKDPPGLELDVGLLARAALMGTAGNDRHSDHEADGDPDRRTGQRPDRRERRADSGRAPLGYFGGLAAAVGLGLIEPPLAVLSAAVPVFKALTNSALPKVVRTVGEVLEGAANRWAATPRRCWPCRTSATPAPPWSISAGAPAKRTTPGTLQSSVGVCRPDQRCHWREPELRRRVRRLGWGRSGSSAGSSSSSARRRPARRDRDGGRAMSFWLCDRRRQRPMAGRVAAAAPLPSLDRRPDE